jgi:hypothetical protein
MEVDRRADNDWETLRQKPTSLMITFMLVTIKMVGNENKTTLKKLNGLSRSSLFYLS